LAFDGFTIDLAGRSLRDCRGKELSLTQSEFEASVYRLLKERHLISLHLIRSSKLPTD
jgi:hypothetical protein